MKIKIQVVMVFALSLSLASCVKQDDNSNVNHGSWMLGANHYTAKSSKRETVIGTDKTISFSDEATNVVGFSFTSYPTSNGTFSISKVGILAGNNNKLYGITKPESNTGKVVTITISSGKATISAANIWLFSTSNVNDSMLFSGTLTEF